MDGRETALGRSPGERHARRPVVSQSIGVDVVGRLDRGVRELRIDRRGRSEQLGRVHRDRVRELRQRPRVEEGRRVAEIVPAQAQLNRQVRQHLPRVLRVYPVVVHLRSEIERLQLRRQRIISDPVLLINLVLHEVDQAVVEREGRTDITARKVRRVVPVRDLHPETQVVLAPNITHDIAPAVLVLGEAARAEAAAERRVVRPAHRVGVVDRDLRHRRGGRGAVAHHALVGERRLVQDARREDMRVVDRVQVARGRLHAGERGPRVDQLRRVLDIEVVRIHAVLAAAKVLVQPKAVLQAVVVRRGRLVDVIDERDVAIARRRRALGRQVGGGVIPNALHVDALRGIAGQQLRAQGVRVALLRQRYKSRVFVRENVRAGRDSRRQRLHGREKESLVLVNRPAQRTRVLQPLVRRIPVGPGEEKPLLQLLVVEADLARAVELVRAGLGRQRRRHARAAVKSRLEGIGLERDLLERVRVRRDVVRPTRNVRVALDPVNHIQVRPREMSVRVGVRGFLVVEVVEVLRVAAHPRCRVHQVQRPAILQRQRPYLLGVERHLHPVLLRVQRGPLRGHLHLRRLVPHGQVDIHAGDLRGRQRRGHVRRAEPRRRGLHRIASRRQAREAVRAAPARHRLEDLVGVGLGQRHRRVRDHRARRVGDRALQRRAELRERRRRACRDRQQSDRRAQQQSSGEGQETFAGKGASRIVHCGSPNGYGCGSGFFYGRKAS